MFSCALIHIGKELPDYFLDCVYQYLLINHNSSKLYIIIDDTLIESLKNDISKFNLDIYSNDKFYFENLVNILPISLLHDSLKNNSYYLEYNNLLTNKFNNLGDFRDGFWISTTARFFYIEALMSLLKIDNLFHIENDIVLFESFENIYNFMLKKYEDNINHALSKPWMVQDSFLPARVVPSILFFPKLSSISDMNKHITDTLANSDTFLNDMNILGQYGDKILFPIYPETNNILFDGAAIGQYLGGVDYRNLPNLQNKSELLIKYDNPTKGFVNETSAIKPNEYKLTKSFVYTNENNIPLKIYTSNSKMDTKLHSISNLHIHSKQLYQFSSIFDIQFVDIISGDRVVELCDFVISTNDIYNFHINIETFTKNYDVSKVIIIKNFQNIKINLLNKYFIDHFNKTGKKNIKLFIYTHILDVFIKYILDYLDKTFTYTIYLHNTDHSLNCTHKKLVESSYIHKIYAQNIDYPEKNPKLHLLPIGIANSMWQHGDMLKLYTAIKNTYLYKKKNSIYININPKTYPYRKNILDTIKNKKTFMLAQGKPYIEYLTELASHRFCLCIRGNGIDTHRFWESLYLGVIPVIINNNTTKCDNFVHYLKELEIPFIELKNDNLEEMFEKYNDDYFNEELYIKLLKQYNSSIYNLKPLKISYYK